jgi:hypothetical protein
MMFEFIDGIYEAIANTFYAHQPVAWAVLAGAASAGVIIGYITRKMDERG